MTEAVSSTGCGACQPLPADIVLDADLGAIDVAPATIRALAPDDPWMTIDVVQQSLDPWHSGSCAFWGGPPCITRPQGTCRFSNVCSVLHTLSPLTDSRHISSKPPCLSLRAESSGLALLAAEGRTQSQTVGRNGSGL